MKINHQKIKIIISDLDGTLLNSDHKIDAFTISVLKKLYDKNYLIIIATGRHHLDAFSILKGLDFPFYLVTSNGARIHSPQKELLFSHNIPHDLVKSVLSIKIDDEITTILFKEKVWFSNKPSKKLNGFQENLSSYPPEIVDFKTIDDFESIKIFFTHHNHQKLLDLREQILEKYPDNFNHAFSAPIFLEFMDKTIDKSISISKILEQEGLTFKETIIFGDAFNDEKMIRKAGIGLVMDNASVSFKETMSNFPVILSNNENGVAKYLSDNFL